MTPHYLSQVNDSKGEAPPGLTNFSERILVVEDEHDLRQLTAEVLMNEGYQVGVAENGGAAWDALKRKPYRLLITDQFVSDLSGAELLQKIREARMVLPVILAAGRSTPMEIVPATGLQPTPLERKPFSFEELLATVRHVFRLTVGAVGDIPLPQPTEHSHAANNFLTIHLQLPKIN